MKLLLDTHVWIWSLLEPGRLSMSVAEALGDPSNELWLSPISVWETLLLIEKGRVELTAQPSQWIEQALRALPARDASVTRDVAIESRALDLSHDDPADRFIAASAIVYRLTLVTSDERLLRPDRYEVMANRPS